MDFRSEQAYPIPNNARLIAEWILGNSQLNRETIKRVISSQEFPYIEDDCLQYLKDQVLADGDMNNEKLERLRQKVRSISRIHWLQNGFIKRALTLLEFANFTTPESH